MDFRARAKDALNRAKEELGSNDNKRLRYAALELRLALEAITYGRLWLYKDDIPPTEYGTWQPKRVMQVLLDIDPYADQTMTLHIGQEKKRGKPANKMTKVGTEHVLSIRVLKDHYDALGFNLHTPTIKQLQDGIDADPEKLRNRCDKLVKVIEEVLSSTMFNVHFGQTATMDCMRCGSKVRSRIPLTKKKEAFESKCWECNATYSVTEKDRLVRWEAIAQKIVCPTKDCEEPKFIWQDEVQPGSRWTCSKCSESYFLDLVIKKAASNHKLAKS